MMPPLIYTVGSISAVSNMVAIIEVVVVFPVRAADGDRPFQAHEFAQAFRRGERWAKILPAPQRTSGLVGFHGG